MSGRNAELDRLLEIQNGQPRGPGRNGALAIWLVARIALDIGNEAAAGNRGELRRLELLAERLRPLVVPPPLQRGLTAALANLAGANPIGARIALSQLVAPAHETIGPAAGEALAGLARRLQIPSPTGLE